MMYSVFVLFNSFLFCSNTMAQLQQISRAYYLAASGNDSNNGTITAPWKTISQINSTQLNPGDTILFNALQVFQGTLKVTSTGTSKKKIIVTSYGKGSAIIDGGNNAAISLGNVSFVTVKKLTLKGSGRKSGNTADGLSIVNCTNIIATDINISGFRNAGLLIQTSRHIRVTKIKAHDNGFAGISITGIYLKKKTCRDIYVGHCRAENNPGSPVIRDNHSGNGIIAGNCSKVLIEYCTATNNGWDMPRVGNGPVGIWCYEADQVTIQHCLSYRNKTAKGADDGGGFDFDGGVTNSVIQYCFSYENQGSAFGLFQYFNASPWNNNTIRYNISENDGGVSAAKASFYIWNNTGDPTQLSNCYVYNNTIYNTKGAALNFASQGERTGFHFYNNIFVVTGKLLIGSTGNDILAGNNWWSIGERVEGDGISDLSFNQDPGFTKRKGLLTSAEQLKNFTHYRLTKSWAIDGGVDLNKTIGIKTVKVGINGKPVPAKGIGACF